MRSVEKCCQCPLTLYTIPGVLSSSFLSFGILKTLESGLDGLNATLMLALLRVRLMRSDTPCTYGKTAKRSGSFSVVVVFWHFFCTFWINFRLYPFTSRSLQTFSTSCFWSLPKIHKVHLTSKEDHLTLEDQTTRIPMRPINSCVGSPTYPLSKYLAKLLNHLKHRADENSIKNSKEFADFIVAQVIEEDEIVVSFDVVALFTSIPIPLAIQVARWWRVMSTTLANACLKRSQVADFHTHLNSINEKKSISFLNCKIATKPGHPV